MFQGKGFLSSRIGENFLIVNQKIDYKSHIILWMWLL